MDTLQKAQLRLECLKPWIAVATRQSIEGKDKVCFARAEETYKFVTETIEKNTVEITELNQPKP